MNKSDFLALKDIFEQYSVSEEALDKLARARNLLGSKRLTDAGLVTIEIGGFRAQVGASTETSTEAFQQLVRDMTIQLIAYYEARLATLDQQVAKR